MRIMKYTEGTTAMQKNVVLDNSFLLVWSCLSLSVATAYRQVCCCPAERPDCCQISGAAWWQPAAASVQAGRRSRVLLRWQGCAGSERVAGMRYAWRESPCAYRHCAVYAAQLPAPPYVACENFRPDGRLHGIRRRP